MLITELKSKEVLLTQLKGKVFVLNCHGCREIRFPEHEADAFQAELTAAGVVTGIFTTEPAKLKELKIMDCMECRCCEYICSSKIPLTTLIKIGKNAVRGMK